MQWEAVNTKEQIPCIKNHTATVIDSKIYIFGGKLK